jgi:TrpR family trp operon transcriptional repressor
MTKFQVGIDKFSNLCLSAKEDKCLTQLFDLFFTAEERNDLAMRYWIIKELIAGKKSQRQIAQELKVSIAKITRGSNEIKRLSPKLLAFLKNNLAF